MSETSDQDKESTTGNQETISEPCQAASSFEKTELPEVETETTSNEFSQDSSISGAQENVINVVTEEVTNVIATPKTSSQPSTSKDPSPNALKFLLHGGFSKVTPVLQPQEEETISQNPGPSIYHLAKRYHPNFDINHEYDELSLIEIIRGYNRQAIYNIECNNRLNNNVLNNNILNAAPSICPAADYTRRTASTESYEQVCRICHEDSTVLPFITPCVCKGSMGPIHQDCLERWLSESGKTACEICGYEYTTQRRARYSGCSSIWSWIRKPSNPNDAKNLFFDIACFFILTPLASISAWLCVVGSQHYAITSQERFKASFNPKGQRYRQIQDATNSTWTSIGLLTLTATLLTAYYVWLFVAFRYHYQVWREWQNRNFIVKVLPISPNEVGGGVDGNVIQRERDETIILVEPGDMRLGKAERNDSSSSSNSSSSTSKTQSLPSLLHNNPQNNNNERIGGVNSSPSNHVGGV